MAISDDFEDGNLASDPDWLLVETGISASETNGNLSQGNSLDLIAQDDYARTLVNGMESTEPTLYESAEHAWWRLRETNGLFHLEASADGVSWKPLRTPQTITLAIDAARLVVEGGTNDPSAPAGAARLDNVNLPPPAQETL